MDDGKTILTVYVMNDIQTDKGASVTIEAKLLPLMIQGHTKGCNRIEVSPETFRIITRTLGEGPYFSSGVRTFVFKEGGGCE